MNTTATLEQLNDLKLAGMARSLPMILDPEKYRNRQFLPSTNLYSLGE